MTRPSKRGHTLIEIVMSTAILTVISGGVFTLTRDSQGVLGASMNSARAGRLCTKGLRRIGDDLELANPATLAISNVSADGDSISLQVPLAVANGVVTRGARSLQAGTWTDFADATIVYQVQAPAGGGPALQLVRRVVDGAGLPLVADEVVADQIDEPDGLAGKGLVVVRNGRLITLTLRVRLSHDDDRTDVGEDFRKSQQATIRLRNP